MNEGAPAFAPSTTDATAIGLRRPLLLLIAGGVAARLLVVDHAPATSDAITLLVATVALVLLVATTARPHESTRITLILSVSTVALIVASLTAPHPIAALYTAPTLLMPIVVFLAAGTLDDDELRFPLAGLCGGALLHAATALYQRFVQWPDALARADELGLDQSVRATFANMRPFGLSLSADLMSGVVLAGLAAAIVIFIPKRRTRSLLVVLVPAFMLAIVVARSTTTFIALGGALGLALILVGRTRLALVGGLASVLLFALSGRGLDAAKLSLTERMLNWRSALDVIAAHPVVGVGPGGYADAYAALRHPGGNVTLYAHSFPLHVMAELGVVCGVAVALAATFVVVRAVLTPRPLPIARAVLVGSAAALLVRSVVDYDTQVGQSAFVFALILGSVSRGVRPAVVDNALARRATFFVTGVVGLAALVVTLMLTARERALTPFERGEEPTADDVSALFHYADAHPRDPTPRSLAARIVIEHALACGPSCTAERAAARARVDVLLAQESPSSIDHTLAARLLLADGDMEGAIREATRALAADSANLLAHEVRVRASLAAQDETRTRHFVDEARRWLTPGQAEQTLLRARATGQ